MVSCLVIAVVSFIVAIYVGSLEVKRTLIKTRDNCTWALIVVGFISFVGFCILSQL